MLQLIFQQLQQYLFLFPHENLTDEEIFDFGVEPPDPGRVAFEIPTVGTVTLSFSANLRHLQCWSLPGRDFICVEPWDGPPNVINTAACRLVEPDAVLTYAMDISTSRD